MQPHCACLPVGRGILFSSRVIHYVFDSTNFVTILSHNVVVILLPYVILYHSIKIIDFKQ